MAEARADHDLIRRISELEQVDPSRLDEVAWVDEGGPYQALDYTFSWRTNQPILAEALRQCLEPLLIPSGGPPSVARYSAAFSGHSGGNGFVFVDGCRVERVRHVEHGFRTVTWHVNREAARVTSHRSVVLHAAAVAKGDDVVLLSAPMESGKSTLAAALVRAGWDYLTDEAVAIDCESLDVTGYPRSITLDGGSWHLFPELRPTGALGHRKLAFAHWHVPPDRIRSGAARRQGRVAAVVLPRYQPGECGRTDPVSAAEAVAFLGQQTFRFREHPQRNLEILARLVSSVPATRLTHADLDEAVRLVEQLFHEATTKPSRR